VSNTDVASIAFLRAKNQHVALLPLLQHRFTRECSWRSRSRLKLFRGRNLLCIGMSASGVPENGASAAADVVLICRVPETCRCPPPIAPQNANQFLRTRPNSIAQREQLFSTDSRFPTAAMVNRCILTEIPRGFRFMQSASTSTGDSLRTTRFLRKSRATNFDRIRPGSHQNHRANTSVTMASNRSLKINLCVSAILSAAIVPARDLPRQGTGVCQEPQGRIGRPDFCALAVIVADTSHTRGASVPKYSGSTHLD